MQCRNCGAEHEGPNPWYCDRCYICADCGAGTSLFFSRDTVLCATCRSARIKRQIAEFQGDTEFTDQVTCPHCGHVHGDSWEMSEGEHACHNCELTFEIERHVEVTYTTTKKE